MTDLGQLREEYDAAVKRRHGKIGATGLEIRADALIAALGDEIAELTGQNIDLEVWRASAVRRAEQAEADADTQFKLRAQAEAGIQTIKALLDEVEQREARRCGTCALWQEWKPGLWDCAEDWCGYSTNPETFGCTRWEQRREG